MKILINAIITKMGGAQVIINSFIKNIDEEDNNEYFFLVYKGAIFKDIKDIKKKNVHLIESLKGDMNSIAKYFWYQFVLPRYIKKNGFDYMLNLSNYGPKKPGCKQILLLHNAKHISKEIKDSYSLKEKVKLMMQNHALRKSLAGTEKLIVQTDYMKNGVIKEFKFDSSKITVIPSSPGIIDTNSIDAELERKLDEFIGDSKNVLVNITLYGKHKNLELLLEAIKRIKTSCEEDFKLILTIDKEENKHSANLIKQIHEYGIQDNVMSVGNISREKIHQLLRRAKAFVFPSYSESFGLPFVEAMQFGLPIIAADLEFAHNVCGDCAVYFKNGDSGDLTGKVLEVFRNDELDEILSKNSFDRWKQFNEKDILNRYLNMLKQG